MELLLHDGGLGSKIRYKNTIRRQNVLFDLVNFKNKHDWQDHKREVSRITKNCKTNYAWKNLEKILCSIMWFDSERNIINDRDRNGMTVFHHAARDKNLISVNFVEALCRFSKDSVKSTNLKTEMYSAFKNFGPAQKSGHF